MSTSRRLRWVSPCRPTRHSPQGPERVALDYFPLFQDGELVAFALRTEGGMFQLDTALARGVGSLGPDQAALVFDRGACWVWDGASLGTAFETAEPVDGRSDLSEGVSPSYFSGVESVELGPAEPLGFSLARDLTARPSGGAGESAPLVSDGSSVSLVAAGAVVLTCVVVAALVVRFRGEEIVLILRGLPPVRFEHASTHGFA